LDARAIEEELSYIIGIGGSSQVSFFSNASISLFIASTWCLVLVDILLTLGGDGKGEFGSVEDDDVGIGGGESGSAVTVGSSVVFGEVCVLEVLELYIVVGVGDDCRVK
nr:hypothetical protein [Tanacetum cinerariifolium]